MFDLVEDLIAEGIEATVKPEVRETVEAILDLSEADQGVSLTVLARCLKLDKSSASRRVRVAILRGHISNLETRKGRPARYVIDDPMPDEMDILPTPEDLEAAMRKEHRAKQAA